MKIQVCYVSKTGHSKKIAEAIAQEVGGTVVRINEDTTIEKSDILFIGGGIYGGKLDEVLVSFLKKLEPETAGRVILFASSLNPNASAADEMRKMLSEKGIQAEENAFHCPGSFLIFRFTRPNKKDMDNAKTFAKEMIKT